MFKRYNKCSYCGSINLKKEKKQFYLNNFYLEAIKSDLGISKKILEKIKVYRCSKCGIIQNNPWFTEDIARKIYSNIYGQHNRNWKNLIDFVKLGKPPNHGKLFEFLNDKIKIRNYGEYNSSFMGLYFNFFEQEYKKNINFYKNLNKNIIGYLTSRQIAGEKENIQRKSLDKAKNFLKKIKTLRKKKIQKKMINKYLFVDNSSLSWGQNDNYKSVNSKSFASEFFDLKVKNIKHISKNIKLDLFGIFHSLDHTFEPKKILNFAISASKLVVVYCHIDERLNKQHLFSLTKEFLKYLNKEKIYTLDLSKKINKKFTSPELYFICSRQKKYIDMIKKNVIKKNKS